MDSETSIQKAKELVKIFCEMGIGTNIIIQKILQSA
mgnify:CR=1 FL=1